MSSTTLRNALPLLAANQAQKHVTHNEALLAIDTLLHLSVVSADVNTPLPAPNEGEAVIIGTAPSGGFSGHAGKLAVWRDGAWRIFAPAEGWLAHVAADNRMLLRAGNAWTDLSVHSTSHLGINATASPADRLVVRAPNSLFSHEGAGHQVKVNKAAPADTATLLFQTAWSGRAEMGLAGSDHWQVKVSADGAGWSNAMTVRNSDGAVGIGTDPTHRLTMRGGFARLGWNLINTEEVNGASSMELMALGTGDRHAYLSFHASPAYGDYHARLIRIAGADGQFCMINRGQSGIGLINEHNAPIYFDAANTRLATLTGNGDLGIGTTTPTTRLHVAGPVRLGNYLANALPDPASSGAGSIIYVHNANGGPVLAFSDGTAWLRSTDRTVVS